MKRTTLISASTPVLWIWMIGVLFLSSLNHEALAMSIRRASFHDAVLLRAAFEQPVWGTLAGCPDATGTNDGPGVAARFSYLGGIVTDAAGNAYVTDSDNHTIRKITSTGIVSTVAGQPGQSGWQDGAATNALFKNPQALARDTAGNLYVADVGNYVIRKISAAGVVTTIAGRPGVSGYANGTGTDALFSFNYGGGLACDTNGNLYVADVGNSVIRKINPAGEVSTFAGQAGKFGFQDGAGTKAVFSSVYGLALDSSGYLYVADSGNHVIRKVSPTGVVTTWVGQPGELGYRDGKGTNARLLNPRGLAIDRQDNVYVAEDYTRLVRKISAEGEASTIGGDAWASDQSLDGVGPFAWFRSPSAVALYPSGHLLVADSSTLRYGTPATEPRPRILRQPSRQTAVVGGNAVFQVAAQGGTPLNYQWLANGQIIVGATNSSLVLESLSETSAGEYRVAVSDGVGYVLSLSASLQVQPAPSGNPLSNWQRITSLSLRDVHGLACGNGRYVAVGGYDLGAGEEGTGMTPPEFQGSLATSTDGEHWVKQFPVTSESLNSVAFGNGTFVVVGNNGTVFTSTNGLAWSPQTLTAEGLPSLHGITFDQALFVAVSCDANGSIWTSPDGTNWTCRGIEFGLSFMAVTAKGGRFIAVGNTIMTSTNGVDWEAANVPTNYVGQEILLGHIASANGSLLATEHGQYGEGIVAASVNGTDWWDCTPTNGLRLSRMTSGNGLFLAVDSNSGGISTSLDGFQWSTPQLISNNGRSCSQPHLDFQNGIFLATGEQDALFTSADGKSWVYCQQEQAMPFAPSTVVGAEGRYFAVGGQGVAASTNGTKWSLVLATNYSYWALAYGAGKLVAVGGNGGASGGNEWIFSSEDDGTTWIDRSPNFSDGTKSPYLSRVAYGEGVFVAVGYLQDNNYYQRQGHILASSKLVNWVAQDFGPTNFFSDVAYGDGVFVALLNWSGRVDILTSTNGFSWKTEATFLNTGVNAIAYGNGRFVIGTSDGTGTVITSTDGKTWSPQTVPDLSFCNRIVFGNGLFLAASSSGLWSSSDGVTWTPCVAPNAGYYQSISAVQGGFIVMGDDGILYHSGPFERLGDACWLSNQGLEWTVTGAPQINYRIEFSEDLLNWQTLERVTNAPIARPFTDPDAATRPSRFYRVVTE